MTRTIPVLLLLLLTVTPTTALSIAGVYSDPIQAENGGEAVQLENPTATPVTLGSYTLATKQSTYPLPAVTLLPGSGYLIADTGWDALKDDASWPAADLEVNLALSNTDGFVEIRDANGTVVERLSWNSTTKAREGELLTKDGATAPFFRNSNAELHTIEATVTILDGAPTIATVTVTDDVDSEPGVQLLSYNRTISVSAAITDPNNGSVSATATFLGKEYELLGNASTFTGELAFAALAPGDYLIAITATDGNMTSEHEVTVHVLSSTSVRISGPLELAGAPGANATGSFTVTNNGNTDKRISVTHDVPGAQCAPLLFSLGAGEEQKVTCATRIAENAPGTRTYSVRILAS